MTRDYPAGRCASGGVLSEAPVPGSSTEAATDADRVPPGQRCPVAHAQAVAVSLAAAVAGPHGPTTWPPRSESVAGALHQPSSYPPPRVESRSRQHLAIHVQCGFDRAGPREIALDSLARR